MYFYDMEPQGLPCDAEYFFNILTICVGVTEEAFNNAMPTLDIIDFWDIQHLTDPRPYVIHIYIDEELEEEDDDYCIELYCHTVVEISPTLGPSWYPMFREDEEEENDLWEIK